MLAVSLFQDGIFSIQTYQMLGTVGSSMWESYSQFKERQVKQISHKTQIEKKNLGHWYLKGSPDVNSDLCNFFYFLVNAYLSFNYTQTFFNSTILDATQFKEEPKNVVTNHTFILHLI